MPEPVKPDAEEIVGLCPIDPAEASQCDSCQ